MTELASVTDDEMEEFQRSDLCELIDRGQCDSLTSESVIDDTVCVEQNEGIQDTGASLKQERQMVEISVII